MACCCCAATCTGIASTDLYALWAVLYELVTGRPPFEGTDPLTIAFKHVNEAPRPPRALNRNVPEDWQALILRSLAKHPADRFATAREMGAAIATLSVERCTLAGAVREDSRPAPTSLVNSNTLVPGQKHIATAGTSAVSPILARRRPPATSIPGHVATRQPFARLQLPKILGTLRPEALAAASAAVVLLLASVVVHTARISTSAVAAPQPVAIWPAQPGHTVTFKAPDGVAIDRRGTVYVADQLSNSTTEIAASGRLVANWDGPGSGVGQFSGWAGLAVDARGDLYAADTGNGRIQELPAGTARWKVVGSQRLLQSLSVAVDPAGTIYVADAGDGVQTLSPAGALDGSLGTGTIHYAAGVALGAGNIYVADPNASRIEVISPRGALLPVFGRHGLLGGPTGVAVDRPANIYIGDSQGNRAVELSSRGRLLHSWTAGSGSRPFSSPLALTLDAAGNIYVADQGNHRVQELSPAGTPVRAWTAVVTAEPRQPSSLAVDVRGDTWVANGDGYVDEIMSAAWLVGLLMIARCQRTSTGPTSQSARTNPKYSAGDGTRGLRRIRANVKSLFSCLPVPAGAQLQIPDQIQSPICLAPHEHRGSGEHEYGEHERYRRQIRHRIQQHNLAVLRPTRI